MAYELIESKKLFSGRIVDVVQDVISLPDGRTTLREVVIRGGAAAVVPVDGNGNIIFVRQYRHPAREMVLEIPAGMIDSGEDAECCAARELTEETGFVAGKIQFITEMFTTIGFSTEVLSIYLAEDLTPGERNLDPDEFVDVETYPLDEAVKMVYDGRIKDSKTMVGILAYKEIISR